MPPQELEAPRQYCDLDNLIEKNQVRFLPVEIAGSVCYLEMTNVGSQTEQEWIAYFDPRKPELGNPGAIEIANRLEYLGTDLIITPSSGKSTEMVEQARERTSESLGKPVNTIVLKRGKPEDMQEEVTQAAFSTTFSPITAGKEERVMVITYEQQEQLLEHLQKGHIITVVDDVYSRGATVRAILVLLNKARGQFEELHPAIVVVMRECVKNTQGELEMPEVPNLYPAIITPVIIGPLSIK